MLFTLGALVGLTIIFWYNFWLAINDIADFEVEVEAEEISKELWKSHKVLRGINK